jgi:predicted Zn finger-like uncharacterized protein
MIVDCPHCQAQFRVPDDAVPAVGRNLRCTVCAHVWHFVPITVGVPVAEPVDFKTVMQETAAVTDRAPAPPSANPATVRAKKPFVVKTKAPFWRTDRAGLMGYAASIIVMLAVGIVARGPLLDAVPTLQVITKIFG